MEADICRDAPPVWNIQSLKEVCKRITSGGTPSRRRPEFYLDGTWEWVKTKELNDNWIEHTEEMITDEAINSSSAKLLPPNTVLLALYGATVGQLGILRHEMTCNQACCAMIVDEEKADYRYLYYQLLTARPQLKRMATGAAQQNLSGEVMKSFCLPFPRIEEQKAIAHILGTLDDKIELNLRMNETLEGMARAIFKSWFVDFDPVHAKMNGRPPEGMSPATAELFPDRFEDSELGTLPSDWEVRSLYDTAEYVNGLAFRNEDFCDADKGLPVVKIAELKSGLTSQTKYTNQERDSSCRIDSGDLLYSWSGSPDTSLDVFVWTCGPGWLNQHIFKVNTRSEAERSFVYFLLRHLRPVLVEIARNKQTTGLGHVTVADMKRLKIAFPTPQLLSAFQRYVGPFLKSVYDNRLQNQTLATIRDALLPKLLSGEIRVSDAEKLAGDIA